MVRTLHSSAACREQASALCCKAVNTSYTAMTQCMHAHTVTLVLTCRFEKYAVSVDSFWELLRAKKDAASREVLDAVLAKCQELISTLGPSTFYGAVPDSTVTTVLLTVLQDQLPEQMMSSVDQQSLIRVLVRAVVTQLLQIMKPHAFLQQAHASVRLPALYESFYNHRQEHYNLKHLLADILGTDPLPSLAFEPMDLADGAKQGQSETAMTEPETSAAAEVRAAAAAQPALLQTRAPQNKWIIFTSTTPDLDMGYIIPAGKTKCPALCNHETADLFDLTIAASLFVSQIVSACLLHQLARLQTITAA